MPATGSAASGIGEDIGAGIVEGGGSSPTCSGFGLRFPTPPPPPAALRIAPDPSPLPRLIPTRPGPFTPDADSGFESG